MNPTIQIKISEELYTKIQEAALSDEGMKQFPARHRSVAKMLHKYIHEGGIVAWSMDNIEIEAKK